MYLNSEPLCSRRGDRQPDIRVRAGRGNDRALDYKRRDECMTARRVAIDVCALEAHLFEEWCDRPRGPRRGDLTAMRTGLTELATASHALASA